MEKNNNKAEKADVLKQAMAFVRRHPLLFNFCMVILVGILIVWLALLALDVWTGHGKYEIVPSLRGLTYQQAKTTLESNNMTAELSDSIYDSSMPPGTVVEQSPRPNTKVKTNRTVYLTVTSFTPKMVTLPSVTDMSERQAVSTLEGIGISNIRIVSVASDYKDLVLGVKYNGLPIQPGTRIPSSATVTLEVGMGIGDDYSDIDSTIVEGVDLEDVTENSLFD